MVDILFSEMKTPVDSDYKYSLGMVHDELMLLLNFIAVSAFCLGQSYVRAVDVILS